MRLRERIQLGIALHAAVNLGFGALAVLTTVPAIAAPTTPAPDPSPALAADRIDRDLAGGSTTLLSITVTTANRRRAQVRAAAPYGGGDRFDRLARCESGGDPTAVSTSGVYRGAFQFSIATWQAAGGTGDPIDAPYDAQKSVAMAWATVVDPNTQWPVCWARSA